MPATSHQPAGTNFLGEALSDSRQKFRQLVTSLEALITAKRIEEARSHLPKLAAMQTELHRVLNGRDGVERKALEQIDRDVARLSGALAEGWSGTVGKGLLAVVLGSVVGVGGLLWLMWKFIG
ncbi:MAG: hypothetical protein FJ293_02830 [Planctomycetes bacterium]|nr:hypothetical protein [Planctomycetota bacterium]